MDWLDHGLKVLAAAGPVALKAEPLARSLKVSRGSFYWHFRDIDDFNAKLLARWRARTTDDVIVNLDQGGSDERRLHLLMRAAMQGDDRLERAIRSWAAQSEVAAEAVAMVDKARLKYLADILKSAGVPPKQVRARAAMIYWAYLGRVMMGKGARTLKGTELDALADLFQS